MQLMPANATGWFWHCLARETGKLGHLYSPGAQVGPYPWFPYALDCGSFSCWNPDGNLFDEARWKATEEAWHRLLAWADSHNQKPNWIIVPDRPGSWPETVERWERYKGFVPEGKRALAVQDGAEVSDAQALMPDVICVGGTTKWKWETWEMWAEAFPRVHVLRVNSPTLLYDLEESGVESCDGTGWNRGDRKQTEGLERFLRGGPPELSSYVCRGKLKSGQGTLI